MAACDRILPPFAFVGGVERRLGVLDVSEMQRSESEGKMGRAWTAVCAWWHAVSTIETGSHRLLQRAGGVVAVLWTLNFLPLVSPFFLPPFPTQYPDSWNLFAAVPHPLWTYGLFVAALFSGWCLWRDRAQRRAALFMVLFTSATVVTARPLTSGSAAVSVLFFAFLALIPGGKAGSLAVFGLRLQVFLIYFCGILYKLADPAWNLGYPLAGTLLGGSWSSAFGEWVGAVLPGGAQNFLGQITLFVEAVMPFLFFFGFRHLWLRRTAMLVMVGLHVGTALLMSLEVFPWVMVAVLLAFWDDELTEKLRIWWEKVPNLSAERWREVAAGLLVALIVFAASVQTLLPALGVKSELGKGFLSTANKQARFGQHWGMFTHSKFNLGESRKKPRKTYRTTRLLVRVEGGGYWDPLTGRESSVARVFSDGVYHADSMRKAVEYSYKAKGRWQRRVLDSLAVWALDQALAAGQTPTHIMTYRYARALDFSKADPEGGMNVIGRMWDRYPVVNGALGAGERIETGSTKAVRFLPKE